MIIFLYGEDSFRSRRKLAELQSKFRQDVDASGASVEVMPGGETDLADLRRVVLAPGLFAKKRFIIFKNFLLSNSSREDQDEILDLLKKSAAGQDDNVLVFWEEAENKELDKTSAVLFKFLKKQKFASEFKFLNSAQVDKWLEEKARQAGSELKPSARDLLKEFLGNNMWALNNEMEKLIAYKPQDVITENDVRLLVSGNEDNSIYYLLDMIASENTEAALTFLTSVLNSSDGMDSILNILKWQINAIALIRGCLDDGLKNNYELAAKTGLHQFVIKKNRVYAERIPLPVLKKIIDSTIELEMNLRKRVAPDKILLSQYVLSLISSEKK